jgi:hypothetical protein
MSYYQDEKPKRKNISDEYGQREFQRSYPTYNNNSYEKERGGCLSAFLVVQFIYTGLIILAACMLMGGGSGSSRYYGTRADSDLIGMVLLVMAVARMGLLAGIWNWNKLSYYLLLGLYGFAIVGSFCAGNLLTAFLGFVEAGIFYGLMQDKVGDFD